MCIGRIITGQEKKYEWMENEMKKKTTETIFIWQMLSLWQIIISDKRNNNTRLLHIAFVARF